MSPIFSRKGDDRAVQRTASFSRAAHESRIVGDGDVGQPVIQPPLLIDLTEVPNRML